MLSYVYIVYLLETADMEFGEFLSNNRQRKIHYIVFFLFYWYPVSKFSNCELLIRQFL